MTDRQQRGALQGTRSGHAGHTNWVTPPIVFASAILLAFAVAAVAREVAPQLTIPLTASFLFAGAAAVAAVAFAQREAQQATRLTHWDIAGALAFLGLGISALIDPDQLVSVLEGLPRQDADLAMEDRRTMR